MTSDYLSMFEKSLYSIVGEGPFDDYVNKELIPLSHLTEKETEWILEIDLPLVNKKDISVTLSSRHIVIKAKLEKTYCVSKLNCVREFNYFKKMIPLPLNVDTRKISAKFNEGILRICMPKIITGKKIQIE